MSQGYTRLLKISVHLLMHIFLMISAYLIERIFKITGE